MVSEEKSTTWAIHIRLLSHLYELPDPLVLIQYNPLRKDHWISYIVTKITAYHERSLREKAANNTSLSYLNVGLLGLSGKPHPALQGISETREAVKFRAHIQLLSGDFPSFEKLGSWHNAEPHCRLCPAPVESTQHILTECKATADVRHDCFLNY